MSKNLDKTLILKNSLLLYVRMLFTMWLNLYTTRLILRNLGVEDFGIYGVVGGIVSMFTIFTNGITSAVQRFMNYELGRSDGNPNKVFYSSLNVVILLSFFILILLESIGIWFLNHKINIPVGKLDSAFWVYQLSVLACIINMVSIPYNSLVIAHERMNTFAYISIIQVVLTCVATYSLSLFDGSRLIIYAIFMAGISVLIRILYQLYCRYHFPEARYRFRIDRNMIIQIGRFAGVSTSSGVLQIIVTQGITFVINWTFGVAINAVYAIALQLKNSILSFALNLLKAISPQITKTYANGEYDSYKKLVYSGSKMEVFLIYFIMIPFLFRTEYILELWLNEIPPYTVEFAQCIVFVSLTYAAFEPLRAAVLATGNITKFMLIPDSFYLLVLPVSYFLCRIYHNPVIMIVCIVSMDMFTCFLRVCIASKVSCITIRELISNVFYPCVKVACWGVIGCYLMSLFTGEYLGGLCLLIIGNSLVLSIVIYGLGLSKKEKDYINKVLLHELNRIKNFSNKQ